MSLSFSEFNSTNKVDLLKQQLSLEEESNLANFNPPKNPIIQSKVDRPVQKDSEIKEEDSNELYYKHHLPPTIDYKQHVETQKYVSMNTLNSKLDHLINLLEEQKEFRTDTILEELILYIFFGIFIIYIVHSFTKVKTYSR